MLPKNPADKGDVGRDRALVHCAEPGVGGEHRDVEAGGRLLGVDLSDPVTGRTRLESRCGPKSGEAPSTIARSMFTNPKPKWPATDSTNRVDHARRKNGVEASAGT